jgi:aryl-alcohol dehydrogenase-like predicted oxidoreductase
VVLAWLVAQGWKPIVGVSSVEQLDSALASASLAVDLR